MIVFRVLVFACVTLLTLCAACVVLAQRPAPAVYVQPMWGIGNRLRTIRVAYDLAKELHVPLILVERKDTFLSKSIQELMHLPVARTVRRWQVPFCVTHVRTPRSCVTTRPLDAFKASAGPFLITSCGLEVPGLADSGEFYKHVRILPDVLRLLAPLEHVLSSSVGVHIRQGTPTDYKKGYFFGAWPNHHKTPPTECCEAATSHTHLCPDAACPLEKYVDAMRAYPATTTFFVAGDRPGCIRTLKRLFPGQIVHFPTDDELNLDSRLGLRDFVALSRCRELLVSRVSSFAHEAAQVNGTPMKLVEAL